MKWISSDGGPLICLGRSTVESWKGGDGLGEQDLEVTGYGNDYERACAIDGYLGVIPVSRSIGIVLGDMPLETTAITSPEGLPLIVRVFYSEPSVDITRNLTSNGIPEEAEEVESTMVSIDEHNWYMFDSAYPGYLGLGRSLSFALPIRDMRIRTFEYKPDELTFLLLHQFDCS